MLQHTCVCPIPSTSISVSDFRKFASAIIAFADFHDTSLMPRNTTIHSHTICTSFGGLAKALGRGRLGKRRIPIKFKFLLGFLEVPYNSYAQEEKL